MNKFIELKLPTHPGQPSTLTCGRSNDVMDLHIIKKVCKTKKTFVICSRSKHRCRCDLVTSSPHALEHVRSQWLQGARERAHTTKSSVDQNPTFTQEQVNDR